MSATSVHVKKTSELHREDEFDTFTGPFRYIHFGTLLHRYITSVCDVLQMFLTYVTRLRCKILLWLSQSGTAVWSLTDSSLRYYIVVHWRSVNDFYIRNWSYIALRLCVVLLLVWLFCVFGAFWCIFSSFELPVPVQVIASICLERLVSEMTYYVSSGT